uniref:Uncharacterized protein n=1 Tax=Aplanochytrium stocchinoi TaxID=215587 RepID=A0A6S8DRP8_9STRA|mmetsp:Transcript_9906/g.11374  ORF Transcript_9906/g.11374 Transcript_9906/m.11374 type:complete len:161 (+) Transcript_9906:136-618(+)
MATAITDVQFQLQKYMLLSGIIQILFCCLEGPAIAAMPNKAMGKAAHHQFGHNGELLIALAFAFPLCNLSPALLWATFFLLQIGTWCNGLSYLIVAATDCPNPLFENTPGLVAPGNGTGNIYTTASTIGLMALTAPGIVFGLLLLFIGVVRSGPAKSKTE